MTQQEQDFCLYYEENMIKKGLRNIGGDKIKEAADLIGIKFDGACPSCLRNSLLELNNVYNRLLTAYNIWKKEQQEPVYTKYEAEVKNEPIIHTDIFGEASSKSEEKVYVEKNNAPEPTKMNIKNKQK
jgi:Fe-S cluster biogenesis protein NfuA